MNLYKKIDLPPIPAHLLKFNLLWSKTVQDIGYGHKHIKNNRELIPCQYIYGFPDNKELIEWLITNIPECCKSMILAQIQESTTTLESTHIVHSDIERKSALNYIIDTGGENVVTSWYKEKEKNLYRNKISGGMQSDSGFINYQNLEILDSTKFEKNAWYALDVEVLHDVDYIVDFRRSITLAFSHKNYLK
jgi:hypothetical protein